MSRFSYYCKEEKKMKPGFPPSNITIYGQAPAVIGDTMDAQRHPGTGLYCESKSAWEAMNKQTGMFTEGKLSKAPDRTKERKSENKKDIHQAVRRAKNDLEYGMAPLSNRYKENLREEKRTPVRKQELNPDALNAEKKKIVEGATKSFEKKIKSGEL